MSVPVALRPLRMLWLEDDERDVFGWQDTLEDDGHIVRLVNSVDDATHLLANQPFDLLILDQDIRGDRAAGTKLLQQLLEGNLGSVNQTIHFMFYTGSREWVLNVDLDVESIDQCLTIAEKGEPLDDVFAEHLERVSHNPSAPAAVGPTSTDATAAYGNAPPLLSLGDETWTGMVVNVEDEQFAVWLEQEDGAGFAYHATFPITRLSAEAREQFGVGSSVLLRVTASEDGLERSVSSNLVVSPAPRLDAGKIAAALEEAKRAREH